MTHVLAVVGGGPRATYALERLSAQLDRLGPGQRLKVLVFERSGEFGAGQAHSPSQPATSFLNRVSSQVSFAADETTTGAGPLRTSRRTLHEWCRERYARTGEPDLDLGPADWPRRYVHGLALREAFDSYAADLRAHPRAELELHHAEVVRLRAGRRLLLQTADGRRFEADQALLVTGHTHHDPLRGEPSRSRARFAAATGCHYVPYAYPLDRLPEETGTVGVAGTGLTAIDVILHLTEGRGGRFEPVAGGLRYVPSGAEPRRVVAFSGSGLFTFCRADDEKGDRAHQGVHLTTEAIDRLRERHPEGLDFERDVLPLIEREMAYLYEAAGGGSFDFARTVDPLASAGAHTPEAYRKAVLDFMELDQRRAEEGNVTNPHKAAADGVWRDLRHVISYAVDDGGLTPGSHRDFLDRWVRVHNRLGNGAAPEVMARLQALIRHGVLDVGAGPGARVRTTGRRFEVNGPVTGAVYGIDTLVEGRVHPFDPRLDANPLFRRMLADGTVRLWRNGGFTPGGLDLDARGRPVRVDGTAEERIGVLGPPTEGRRSFQLSALRPGTDHYVMRDVLAWLSGFWEVLGRPEPAAGCQPGGPNT